MVLGAFRQIPEIDKYIFIAKEDRMDATHKLSMNTLNISHHRMNNIMR